MSEEVSVLGVVSEVHNPNEKKGLRKGNFKVFLRELKKEIHCSCQEFLPLQPNDVISGDAEITEDKKGNFIFVFEKAPLAYPSDDKSLIVSTLSKKLGGLIRANLLYEIFEKQGNAIECMNRVVNTYHSKKEIPPFLECVEKRKLQIFMTWWRARQKRKLMLLGLSSEQISMGLTFFNGSYEKLYSECRRYPFRILSLSIDYCLNIISRVGLKFDSKKDKKLHKKLAELSRILYENLTKKKWIYTPLKKIPQAKEYLEELEEIYEIKNWKNRLYLKEVWEQEEFIVSQIQSRLGGLPTNIQIKEIDSHLRTDQKAAITGCLQNRISCIYGAAGTGKTTSIRELVKVLKSLDKKFCIGTFTGKAAVRVNEVLGENIADTLDHFILKGENSDIEVFIVDEGSMVSYKLGEGIFKTFSKAQIVFFLDPNQLLPINYGCLGNILLEVEKMPKFKLLKNERNCDQILYNANKLVDFLEKGIEVEPEENEKFRMVEGGEKTLYKEYKKYIESGIPRKNIKIICPYNAPAEQINNTISEMFCEGKPSVEIQGETYFLGDIVIVEENQREIKLMNGEMGEIVKINRKSIVVEFGKRQFTFLEKEEEFKVADSIEEKRKKVICEKNNELSIDLLNRGDCITVDKMQGSQEKVIILYIPKEKNAGNFLTCNRMYTSITRAEEEFLFVGRKSTFFEACNNLQEKIFEGITEKLNVGE